MQMLESGKDSKRNVGLSLVLKVCFFIGETIKGIKFLWLAVLRVYLASMYWGVTLFSLHRPFLCLSSTILDPQLYVYNNHLLVPELKPWALGSQVPSLLGGLAGILFTIPHCFSGLLEAHYTRENKGRGHMHLRKSIMELRVSHRTQRGRSSRLWLCLPLKLLDQDSFWSECEWSENTFERLSFVSLLSRLDSTLILRLTKCRAVRLGWGTHLQAGTEGCVLPIAAEGLF